MLLTLKTSLQLILLLLWLLPALAPAEEASASAAASASAEQDGTGTRADTASALVAEIREANAALLEMRRAPEAETNDAAALRALELADEELRVGALIDDLGKIVLGAPEDESLAEIRVQLRELLKELPTDVFGLIERRQQVLADALAAREEAPPEQAFEFEEQVLRSSKSLDKALRYYTTQLPLLNELNIDTAQMRAGLLDRITKRAETVAGRIRLTREAQRQLAEVLANDSEDGATKLRLTQLERRLDLHIESLRLLINLLKGFDVDTTGYQKLLVETTGDVADIGLNTTVMTALLQDWWDKAVDWLVDSGPRLLGKAFSVVLILCAAWYLSRFARRLIERAFRLRPSGASQLLQITASKLAGQFVFLLGLLVALSQIGVSIGPMLAGLGIAGFVVGFALQDVLANFASGALILFYRPFDVGDIVEAGGVNGKVQAMNLVSTTILTFDNQTLIVPNKKIWGDVIRNVTTQQTRRVDLTFGIGYSDDIENAERILKDVVSNDHRVLAEPAPVIRLSELGDSSVNFLVRPWVRRDDYWDVYWDLTRAVKLRFDAEGITIPFPQQDVHHYYPQGHPSAGPETLRRAPTRSSPRGAAHDNDGVSAEADTDDEPSTPEN